MTIGLVARFGDCLVAIERTEMSHGRRAAQHVSETESAAGVEAAATWPLTDGMTRHGCRHPE